MKTSNITKPQETYTIFTILIIVYGLVLLTPLLAGMVGFGQAFMLTMIVFLWILFFYKNLFKERVFYLIFSFFLLDLFYHLIGYSERIGNAFSHLVFFLNIIFFLSLRNIIREKGNRVLFCCLLLIVIANVVDNIRLNTLYPMASIIAIRYDEFIGMNVGTTSFNTMTLLFYNLCFFLALNHTKWRLQVLFLICSLTSAYYIVMCGMRGSVVLIMALTTLLQIMAKWYYNNAFARMFVIIGGILSVLLYELYQDVFFDFLASILPEGRLIDRVEDLSTTAEYGFDRHSFSGRYNLYLISINSWLQNITTFLFGIGEHMESAKEIGYANSGVGGHSEFIDVFARWGIIGAYLIFSIYYEAYKILMQSFKGSHRNQVKILFFSFLMCTVFKKVFYPSIGIVFFILVPLSSYFLYGMENSKKKHNKL